MKNTLLIFLALSSFQFSSAQLFEVEIRNKILNKVNTSDYDNLYTEEELKEIKGSPYAKDGFSIGNVYVDDKIVIDLVKLRYNASSDQIEIKDGENISALVKSNSVSAKILEDLYVVATSNLDFEEHYYKVIIGNKKASLYERLDIDFIPPTPAKSGFEAAQPAEFKQKSTFYFIKDNSFTELPNSKSKIYKLFEDEEKKVISYAKSNKLNPKDIEDLKQIIEFYNSL